MTKLFGDDEIDTASSIAGFASVTKTSSLLVEKGSSLYINSVMENGRLTNLLPFTKGTEKLVKQAEYTLKNLKPVSVFMPGAEKVSKSLTAMSYVQKLAPIARVAGGIIKLAAPVIESPISLRVYNDVLPENASFKEKSINTVAGIGDAVSFGPVRSIMKTPTLLKLYPGDIPCWSDSRIDNYANWINQNINGIQAGNLIFGKWSAYKW